MMLLFVKTGQICILKVMYVAGKFILIVLMSRQVRFVLINYLITLNQQFHNIYIVLAMY